MHLLLLPKLAPHRLFGRLKPIDKKCREVPQAELLAADRHLLPSGQRAMKSGVFASRAGSNSGGDRISFLAQARNGIRRFSGRLIGFLWRAMYADPTSIEAEGTGSHLHQLSEESRACPVLG